MRTIKIIPYLILLLTIPSIVQWLNIDTNNLTALWWLIELFIIYYFVKGKAYFYKNTSLPIFVKLFLILVVFQAIYGVFRSDGYWDYKELINSLFAYLLPLSIYIFSNPKILGKTIKIWFRYGLILFWVILPFMQPEAPGKYLIPIMFLILFIKPLSLKYKIIILIYFSFVFIYGSLGARSSVLKYSIALLFGLSMYLNIYRFKLITKILHLILMVFPLILFLVGVSGIFNVFEFDKYLVNGEIMVTDSYNRNEKENLTWDTRTFIYQEAISSAINNNYVIQGNSLARGYDSPTFAFTDFYNRGERYNSEVSIVNIFTHFGLIGVIIYWLIFLSSTYLSIYKSNNYYSKMIGLYVSTRWVFSWVEDFSRFDLNYLFVWIMLGMSYSLAYRNMNNREFEYWIRSIFVKKRVVKKVNVKLQNL